MIKRFKFNKYIIFILFISIIFMTGCTSDEYYLVSSSSNTSNGSTTIINNTIYINTTNNNNFYYNASGMSPYLYGNNNISLNESALNYTINNVLDSRFIDYLPSSVFTSLGTNLSGNLSSLYYVDSITYNISESLTGIIVLINFSNVSNFNLISINELYIGSPSHIVYIQLFDLSLNSWINISSFTSQDTFNTITSSIAGNTSRYINNSIVNLRLIHYSPGITTHRLYLDFVNLGYNSVGLISSDMNNYLSNVVYDNVSQNLTFYRSGLSDLSVYLSDLSSNTSLINEINNRINNDSYLQNQINNKLNLTDQRFNETNLINSVNISLTNQTNRINTLNITKGGNGTCASGMVIQNVTISGVQCVTDQTGGGSSVQYNSTYQCSGTDKLSNVSIINGNITGVCTADSSSTTTDLDIINLVSAQTFSNIAAAETEFQGTYKMLINLSSFTQFRLSTSITVTAASSRVYLKYNDTLTTNCNHTITQMSNLSNTNSFIPMGSVVNRVYNNTWSNITTNARNKDICLYIATNGGDGAADPQFRNLMLQVK